VRKFSRRTTIIASGMALVLATSVLAFAFWTGIGTGTGQAQTGNVPSQTLQVTQNGTPGGLTPGGPGAALSGTVVNPNPSGVHVNEVKATVDSIVGGPQDPNFNPCTPADFDISGNAVVNAVVPGANGSLPWSGLTLSLLNTVDDQENCKNVTVNLKYTTT
jgi:hypothetical protein